VKPPCVPGSHFHKEVSVMPEGFARVAAVSLPVHLGDVQANVNEILAAMETLEKKGVQVALFPELCLTGATLGDLVLRPELHRKAWKGLMDVAQKAGKMAVVVGLPVQQEGRLYNCAAVVQDGKVQGIVPKACLTQEESRWFVPGGADQLFIHMTREGDYSGSVSLSTRHVFGHIDGSFTFAVDTGDGATADIMLNPGAQSAVTGGNRALRDELRNCSKQLCAGYAYACTGFGESTSDHVYDGFTGIYENGEELAAGERFSMNGSMAIADVDVEHLRYQRQQTGWFRANPEESRRGGFRYALKLPQAPLPLMRKYEPLPFVPHTEEGLEEIAQIQCMGLASRMKAIRCENLVIGVSGGLDSTLALLIAARTFDLLGLSRKGIHAITMPGMGTGARTKTNADRLMEALEVSAGEIPIGPAVQQHFADIGHPENKHDVTYENSQARERTQILMDYANKVNGIVLGTGDLSEEALGFCTYNGDHMSMYNVNCTVTKTCLKSLTRYLSAHSFNAQVAAICQDVLDTPISPELLPVSEGELNQRTEDILGDYALHDFFLYHFIRSGASREKLQIMAEHAFCGVYDADKIAAQLKTFMWRFYTQQFKRSCAPDGPQTGPVSLSPRGGWDMPSDIKPIG